MPFLLYRTPPIDFGVPKLAKKRSFICVGGYYSNSFLLPQRNPATGIYATVLQGRKETPLLVINSGESTGLYIRALVENEAPRLRLHAYRDELRVGDSVDLWAKVTGEKAHFILISPQDMHDNFKVSWEVLEAVSFVAEFGHTAGIEVVTPEKLNKSKMPSFRN